MADPAVYPPHPEDDGIVRQTQHTATIQPPGPRVSYEAETYQEPQAAPPPRTPNINDYQAPSGTQNESVTPATAASPPNPERFPGLAKPIPEEVVLEWVALSRPFKQRGRQYFSTILIIGLLLSLILFFAGQTIPIAVIIAVIFFYYVLNVTPPGMVNHSLTTYGVRVENQLYYWEELGRFWFTTKHDQRLLHIEVSRFPWRLTLLLGEVPEQDMMEILSEVLMHQQPQPTQFEKWAGWLQEKIPLEG